MQAQETQAQLIQGAFAAFDTVAHNVPVFKFKKQVLVIWPALGSEMENCETSEDVFNVLKNETNWSNRLSICELIACFDLLAGDVDALKCDLSLLLEQLGAIEKELRPTFVNVVDSNRKTLQDPVKVFNNHCSPNDVSYTLCICLLSSSKDNS